MWGSVSCVVLWCHVWLGVVLHGMFVEYACQPTSRHWTGLHWMTHAPPARALLPSNHPRLPMDKTSSLASRWMYGLLE